MSSSHSSQGARPSHKRRHSKDSPDSHQHIEDAVVDDDAPTPTQSPKATRNRGSSQGPGSGSGSGSGSDTETEDKTTMEARPKHVSDAGVKKSRAKSPKTENWAEISEPEERRRIQNRIAQRKFSESPQDTFL
jgi:hypothetical protein